MAKSPEAFRTISEASDELQVPQHVLRFWETKFSFLRPMKRAGGRRLYRPQDLSVLRGVQILLYRDGYTIKGVQKLYKDHGIKRVLTAAGLTMADAPVEAETPVAAPAPAATVIPLAGDDLFATPVTGAANTAAVRLKLEQVLLRLTHAKAQIDQVLGR